MVTLHNRPSKGLTESGRRGVGGGQEDAKAQKEMKTMKRTENFYLLGIVWEHCQC